MSMMVDKDDSVQEESQAEDSGESSGGSDAEMMSPSQQSFYSRSDDDDDDSVKIMHLTDKERERRLKKLDAEMSEKMQEIHQLMSGGGLTGATRFIEQNFHLTQDRVRPLVAAPHHDKAGNHKTSDWRASLVVNQRNVNVNHKACSNPTELSQSIETIYKNAVKKRVSSSSEECVDISDETLGLIAEPDFVPDYEDDEEVQPTTSTGGRQGVRDCSNPMRVTDGARRPVPNSQDDQELTPEEKAEKHIIEAEAAKANIFAAPSGKRQDQEGFRFIAEMDQDYLVVGSHIDENMQSSIIRGEYIDFGKLLPKDRVTPNNEGRMELTMKNGRAYWSPVMDTVAINGFSRWEQAFRIFSNVYTRRFPEKSGELIQYNHIIHSIANQYVWENVYSYDKEFRMHLARHPNRSWAVILQQAWLLKLHDRLSRPEASGYHANTSNSGSNSGNHWGKVNEPYRQYNRGKCNFGTSCMFDHKCAYEPCGKFGHNILNCRKLAADKERQSNKRKETGHQPTGSRKEDNVKD